MAESLVLKNLADKRKEIESHIGSLEQDLEQARRDLSAILAATKVFSAEGYKVTAYMQLTKLFPRHVLPKLCQTALNEATAGISTTGIAAHIIAATGLDQGDRHLRKSIAYKVVQVTRRWERERKIVRLGKVGGAIVWTAKLKATPLL